MNPSNSPQFVVVDKMIFRMDDIKQIFQTDETITVLDYDGDIFETTFETVEKADKAFLDIQNQIFIP